MHITAGQLLLAFAIADRRLGLDVVSVTTLEAEGLRVGCPRRGSTTEGGQNAGRTQLMEAEMQPNH